MTRTGQLDPRHRQHTKEKTTAIQVHNPATGELVGSIDVASAESIAAAACRARAAQQAWQDAGFTARARVIRRFHDCLVNRSPEVLDTIQAETGKSRRDALAEIVTVAGTARYHAAHGARHLRTRRHRAAVPLLTNARVMHKPIGLVGLITPWNYPFLLGIADALPALLAGNAVLTKPSELTPFSTGLAREMLIESGLEPDLLGVLNGPGPEVGGELIRHVDYVGFTGSTATGRTVATAAAGRLIPCSLELGGKNPMVVLAGARLERAVTGLINGAFTNSGQSCISIERAYVEDGVYDEFLVQVAARTRALRVGWSHDWGYDMGSLSSSEHADRVEAHVRDAVARGARIVVGGKRRRDLGDAFFEPTVLADVGDEMQVAAHETFGPVVSVYRVRDAGEAIERANASSYGLNASVWAGNGRAARRLGGALVVGSANVNSTMLIYNSFDVPMGGVRESGIGHRHGVHGIQRYTVQQSIVGSVPWLGGYDSLQRFVSSARRARLLLRIVKAWRHIPGAR